MVAALNVLRGLPENRTTIGAALTDTATEVTSGAGVAITGTILAAVFPGTIAAAHWTARQTTDFHTALTLAGLTLTALAAVLVAWGLHRSRTSPAGPAPESAGGDAASAHDAGAPELRAHAPSAAPSTGPRS